MPLFMANPVIPWQHDYDRGPVAQATRWSVDQTGLVLEIVFDVKKPLGLETWNSYEGGFLRAFSVGFAVEKSTPPMKPQKILEEFGAELPEFVKADLNAIVAGDRDVPGGFWGMKPEGITVATQASLLEASCVTVPADRYALVRAIKTKAMQFVDELYRSERPGWEDTTLDDLEAGQIRYRIKEPSLFDEESFVTLSIDVKGEGDVQKVRGKLKDAPEGEADKLVDQAVHFNKSDGWTMDAAKNWWGEHETEHAGVPAVERIGKVISAKNKSIIEQAIAQTKEAVSALEAVLAAAEGGDAEESHGTESDADRQVDDELRQRIKRIIART